MNDEIASIQPQRSLDSLASHEATGRSRPAKASDLLRQAELLLRLNRWEQAQNCADTAISLGERTATSLTLRGVAQNALARREQALSSFEQAIALQSDYEPALVNRGVVLRHLQRFEESLQVYDAVLARRPDCFEALSNRASVLTDLGRHAEALGICDRLTAVRPDQAELHLIRAAALLGLQRFDAALESLTTASSLQPANADTHFNLGCLCLLLGRFDLGWQLYEWRNRRRALPEIRRFTKPQWGGREDIAGRTVFLYADQGLGDTLQFCRYAPLVQSRGAKVVLSVQNSLRRLLSGLSPHIEMADEAGTPAHFDYHCPLSSLAAAFKTTLATIPANTPYLSADPQRIAAWRDKLGAKQRFRVGLVWSGGARPRHSEHWSVDQRRNIPLTKLAALKTAGVEFYSLQKGQPAESELTELLRGNWSGPPMIDVSDSLHDFSDTAGLVAALDLVISVDTSTAHLAGALGRPVWLLNRFDTCWRWLLDRTDSPWYPTMRLYRQSAPNDWDGVIQRVQADLATLAG